MKEIFISLSPPLEQHHVQTRLNAIQMRHWIGLKGIIYSPYHFLRGNELRDRAGHLIS